MKKPEKNEIRKPTKTLSGVTPLAVMLPPRKCNHGLCIYCPDFGVPQSYTPKSPVAMRAKQVKYDSYKQVKARIEAFKAMNHKTEKIEIIIMGGTFLQYPEEFQYEFIKGIYNALNEKKSKTLEQAKKLNEKSKHRCIALCIETRPDSCTKHIKKMREFGATRIELGVQIINNKIYEITKRGHNVKDVINTTRELKNAGFKIGYHIMPGLPGSNLKKDLKLFKKLFSDSRFRPDQLKIYPCQVMPNCELEKMYWKKQYKPYTKEQIEKLLIKMLKNIPRYCRVMRVMREIPPEYIIAGTKRIDLRAEIEKKLRKDKTRLKEIRYREIGFNRKNKKTKLRLKITKYKASKGKEYFIEVINKEDILFGLLRLRIINKKENKT
ncbi:MAG: elongator complex protein 3, partial [Nanoarchaeota archaeon]